MLIVFNFFKRTSNAKKVLENLFITYTETVFAISDRDRIENYYLYGLDVF